jgi:hypothetical protein
MALILRASLSLLCAATRPSGAAQSLPISFWTRFLTTRTTASDALWAGVPVITCVGPTFAGRVAASLLQAVGLPELITNDLEEYETLARKLATDPALLGSLRERLAQNRTSHPLFDTQRLTRHIEAAYTTMMEPWQRGEPTKSFSVEAIAR